MLSYVNSDLNFNEVITRLNGSWCLISRKNRCCDAEMKGVKTLWLHCLMKYLIISGISACQLFNDSWKMICFPTKQISAPPNTLSDVIMICVRCWNMSSLIKASITVLTDVFVQLVANYDSVKVRITSIQQDEAFSYFLLSLPISVLLSLPFFFLNKSTLYPLKCCWTVVKTVIVKKKYENAVWVCSYSTYVLCE